MTNRQSVVHYSGQVLLTESLLPYHVASSPETYAESTAERDENKDPSYYPRLAAFK